MKLYHDNEYSSLALVLPGLLGDARDASPLLRSRVYQFTGALMVQTRQRDTARIALGRSLADAEESGNVLDAASSVITMCWLLLLEKQFDQVSTMALAWADRIEPKFSIATPAELSAWRWLQLRASAAAIRVNRAGDAAHAMRLAQAAALIVGRERGLLPLLLDDVRPGHAGHEASGKCRSRRQARPCPGTGRECAPQPAPDL